MSVDTNGRIRGYASAYDIYNYIKENWDSAAGFSIRKTPISKINELNMPYKINDHFKNSDYWFVISASIVYSRSKGKTKTLFYCYNNVNFFENLDFYKSYGLEEMVKSETVSLSLDYDEYTSVQEMEEIIENFGGGWIEEVDYNDNSYREIEGKANLSIKGYEVSVTESLVKKVFVSAGSYEEALKKVKEQYNQENIVLDKSDVMSVQFK